MVAAVLWGAGLAAIELRWTRRFEAPYPPLAASVDPAVVAEGEYLVYSAAACAYCHVPREQWAALDRGEQPRSPAITCSGSVRRHLFIQRDA